MQDYEKLGVFYLGREYDLETGKRTDNPVLYDSRDLVTHAVCVGMTGSGKTGLCICLLEEAAIDHIPSIVIDPKGDLANLLLTFPDLTTEEFSPWINEEEAAQKGITAEALAAKQAQLWRNGLAEWDQDAERIRKLKESCDFTVYTPGSNAGTPVSILKSFAAPAREIQEDSELVRDKITTTATSLLSLLGMDANPLTSREHILLSTIFDLGWKQGDLDLPEIIHQIQTPPVTKIGVIDLESFFPAKERFAFALSINHLLAAPGFDVWFQGEPLNVESLLFTSDGKPRVSIFSIAHLNDAEQMFFVTLLLTQVLGWVRTQPGTSSLRAILYMDEIFGYFPPVANPPSKQPVLTLLKQARAFGLGVVLATQNPVDLDYKGLANAGTWFIGRLQTERDKARLLEGLEGVAAGGQLFDRAGMEQVLAGLSTRIFLMKNVHEQEPVLFESRWALSYLAGPLTRAQIQKLKKPLRAQTVEVVAAPASPSSTVAAAAERPVLPPEVTQYFLPIRGSDAAVYAPKLWGSAKIFYADAKVGIAAEQEISLLNDFNADWDNSERMDVAEGDLDKFPPLDAAYADLPPEAASPKSYAVWKRSFADWLFRTQSLKLFKSNLLGQISRPSETEKDFRIRLQQAAREERDRQIEKLRQKYSARIASLQDRIRRAEQTVEREKQQAQQQKVQTAISFGTTVLGALFGRKKLSTSTLGRATTAARGMGRSMKETQDIARAEESVMVLQKQLADLEEQLKIEARELETRIDPQTETFQTVEMRPKKINISVKNVALAWVPQQSDKNA
ncbi:ATP-binding protein [bacterium]|nr:ATP-binding protein [bacterium]